MTDDAVVIRLRQMLGRLHPGDPQLTHLINLAQDSSLQIQMGIVCVLGSTVARGVPVPPEKFATKLDDEVRAFYEVSIAIAKSREQEASPLEEILTFLEDSPIFATPVNKETAERQELLNELYERKLLESKITDYPEDLAEKAIRLMLPPSAFTLTMAQVRYPDGDWEDVGTMRVAVKHVNAWWPFRLGTPDDAIPYLPDQAAPDQDDE